MLIKSLVISSLVLSSTIAAAQPGTVDSGPAPLAAPAAAEKTDSINVSPLGLLFGSYAVTYEHLWKGEHGLIVEGTFSRSSTDGSSSYGLGGSVGYRWHWRGKQDSGFLGVTASQSFGHGEATVGDGSDMQTFGVGVSATTLTMNIGKRWMLTDAVNITLRAGLGWAHYAVNAETDDPDAKMAEQKVNDLLELFPVGFEGELSLGYVF